MRCPYCRRSAVGWPHVALVTALDAAGLNCLMKLLSRPARRVGGRQN
jgi:hypothetical protein